MNIISGKLKISQQSGCAQQSEKTGEVLKERPGNQSKKKACQARESEQKKSLPGINVATPATGTLISSQSPPACCDSMKREVLDQCHVRLDQYYLLHWFSDEKMKSYNGRTDTSCVHLSIYSFVKHLLGLCHVLSPGPCLGMKTYFGDTVLASGNPCNHEQNWGPANQPRMRGGGSLRRLLLQEDWNWRRGEKWEDRVRGSKKGLIRWGGLGHVDDVRRLIQRKGKE